MAPSSEPLDFAVTYESLFHKALRADVTPRLKERLRALGLDLDRPLLPGYPAALWPQVIRATAEELFAGVPFDLASQRLAERFIAAYFETPLGSAVAMVMRVLGPRRALERLERTLRSTNNYQQSRFTLRGEREADLWIGRVSGVPGWFIGLFGATARHIGAEGATIELVSQEGPSATFRLSWP